MTAIAGTRRQYKEMADGTLRVSIDIDPQFKQQFLELFPGIDMPVALAPLQADFEQKKPEEQKGGPLSKSAAMQCQYPPFQSFAVDTLQAMKRPFDGVPEDVARNLILAFCSIKSRSELDHNAIAAARYTELMEMYRKWNHG